MKRDALIAVVLFALVALVPFSGEAYWLRLGTTMLMYGVIAMSWNFIGGMAGYPSFAVAAFFGLGAYTGAVAQKFGLPMGLAWTCAGLAALAFAALLGVALLRLRGHYFAIASLVVAEVLRELVNSATELTGGGMGLNLPIPTMTSIDAQAAFFFYAMLGLVAITFAAMLLTTYSKLGFGLRCIQQNESAADMLGVDTTFYKVSAFMLSGVFVGMAGAVYASWVHYIEPPDVFDVLFSVKAIVMVLLGGAGSVFGPLFGAALFLSLEELVWRKFLEVHTGVLGLLIVLLVMFLPKGLLSLSNRLPWARKTR
ncbi:MAG: branched-chain amino acid ABC transporter permease [Betaproteobacteria bacterium]|nr:branched-chain amino acid ABC transporter permease [Betaproteobacteria bacterium]